MFCMVKKCTWNRSSSPGCFKLCCFKVDSFNIFTNSLHHPPSQARTKLWPQHLSSSVQLYQWEVFSHFHSTFLTPIRAEAGGRSAWSDVPHSLSALSHSRRGCCDGGSLYGNALYSSKHNENSAAFKAVAVMGLFTVTDVKYQLRQAWNQPSSPSSNSIHCKVWSNL